MRKHGVKNFIFSSSCTVYGVPQYLPLDEEHPTGQACTNPYGRTKYFIEEMLKDLNASEKVCAPSTSEIPQWSQPFYAGQLK